MDLRPREFKGTGKASKVGPPHPGEPANGAGLQAPCTPLAGRRKLRAHRNENSRPPQEGRLFQTKEATSPMPDSVQVTRLPRGSECQCMAEGCGLFFTGETAFNKHWTKAGHAHPSTVGLVEKERVAGPIWGWPGQNPTIAQGIVQEAENPGFDAPSPA